MKFAIYGRVIVSIVRIIYKRVSREGQPRSKVLLGDSDVCLKDPGKEVVPGMLGKETTATQAG